MIDGKEYYLAPVEKTNWYQADAKALEMGAYLLEIDSSVENNILEKIKHCKLAILKFKISFKILFDVIFLFLFFLSTQFISFLFVKYCVKNCKNQQI